MNIDELPMRIAVDQMRELTDGALLFIKQMDIQDVQFKFVGRTLLPGDARQEYMDLVRLRTRCEDAGFRLITIENVPPKFYDKAMLGLTGCDEQSENMQTTIRNIGWAGIPIFGYHWMPNSVWRTSNTAPARGRAKTTAFDMELAENAPLAYGRIFTEEELWASYEYFNL